jgi:hypothetical protein
LLAWSLYSFLRHKKEGDVFEICYKLAANLVEKSVDVPKDLNEKTVNAISYFYDRAVESGLIGKTKNRFVYKLGFFSKLGGTGRLIVFEIFGGLTSPNSYVTIRGQLTSIAFYGQNRSVQNKLSNRLFMNWNFFPVLRKLFLLKSNGWINRELSVFPIRKNWWTFQKWKVQLGEADTGTSFCPAREYPIIGSKYLNTYIWFFSPQMRKMVVQSKFKILRLLLAEVCCYCVFFTSRKIRLIGWFLFPAVCKTLEEDTPFLCLDLTFISALLQTGYNLKPNLDIHVS